MDKEIDGAEQVEYAIQIAGHILKFLYEAKCPENIGQAALGNAWFRLCLGMEFTPQQFQEMCDVMATQYKIAHKKYYKTQ